eukprot:s847_g22.t1
MELHEKLAVLEVLGSMPMALKTRLLQQSNDLSLWDRIAMFHRWARQRQRGIDVVQELNERPGIAGLPVLDWTPQHDHPAPEHRGGDGAGIHGHPQLQGDRASSHGQLAGDRDGTQGHLGGDRASMHGHFGIVIGLALSIFFEVIGLPLKDILNAVGLAFQDTVKVIGLAFQDTLAVIKWATEHIFMVIGRFNPPTSTTIGLANLIT